MSIDGLLQLDMRATQALRVKESSGLGWHLATGLAHSGDSWLWLAFLVAVLLLAVPPWREAALILAIGIVALALFVFVLKKVIGRARPDGEWGAFYRLTDPHSFPSGHAARGFMIAVFSLALGVPWLSALLWLWATALGLSRVATGLHYLSDTLGGILLGVLAGWILIQLSPWLIGLWSFL